MALADPFDSIKCPPSTSVTTYYKLKSALLCNYDSSVRPVANHQNSTAIYFKFILKYFTYDVTTSTLSIDTWMRVSWKDQHLIWRPDDYEKNREHLFGRVRRLDSRPFSLQQVSILLREPLQLKSKKYLKQQNNFVIRAVQGGDPSVVSSSTTKCTISSDGLVLCVPSVHIDTLCVPNLRSYPYDSQNCAMRVGSWVHKGEELDLKITKDVVSLKAMEANGEWEIEAVSTKKYAGHYKCCPNVTFPSVEVNFKIKRLHGAHAASVIIPTIVAVILTFTSLSTSLASTERLAVCYVNVVVQFMHVQYLSWQIPLKGDQIPLLLLFARDSLLMAVFTVVFTIILRNIKQKQVPANNLISSFVSCVIGCSLGQYLFLDDNSMKGVAMAKGEEDGTNIVSSTENNVSDWAVFAKIVDFLLLVCYIIVYLVMTLNFVP
ncbi:hypothetical protein NQ315_007131 [Exocentrus adspersus]|uniref:Neurotransmitter-gated ion-channel ligand-binding domain-containing protein n=1 Tax=Exocentrus adspersus TaxID=1586481 RepID=A0AAV8WE42_9CUCU|nr:hypothetical protein NQ315_007131 [Exocentrus adspersus]